MIFLLLLFLSSAFAQPQPEPPAQAAEPTVILTFDDNYRSQYSFAEPILREYGFNATFFIYCDLEEDNPDSLTWNLIQEMANRGYDIQSHSMTHLNLVNASSASELEYEVAESKNCLQENIGNKNVTIFATPYASGEDNSTVLEAIQNAGYEFARAGYSNNFDLACDQMSEPGCPLMYENGTLKEQNRFNIPTSNMNGLARDNDHDLNRTQTAFIQKINENIFYDDNNNSTITSLPVLVYHNFSDTVPPAEVRGPSMLTDMFRQQMKYLYDNDYNVLSMRDLKYNQQNDTFTIEN